MRRGREGAVADRRLSGAAWDLRGRLACSLAVNPVSSVLLHNAYEGESERWEREGRDERACAAAGVAPAKSALARSMGGTTQSSNHCNALAVIVTSHASHPVRSPSSVPSSARLCSLALSRPALLASLDCCRAWYTR